MPSKAASSKLKAKTILSSTQDMGDYIYNVGNHDLAAGFGFLEEMDSTYDISFISSNIVLSGTNDLAFEDHRIIERNNLKIGIFGLMRAIPPFVTEVEALDISATAQKKIKELRPQVDILVLLLNAERDIYKKIQTNFQGIDYIFSSRETTRTRPESKQNTDGPLKYNFGIQGKYIGRFDISLKDNDQPIKDITVPMMTIKSYEDRLNNLQKQDPSKPLEELYKDNVSALNLIGRLKQGIAESKKQTKDVANYSYFNLIYLSSKIPSEKKLLNLVNQTLKTCDELDKQGKKTSP